jgi:hypothetical protein
MKVWELASIARSDEPILKATAEKRSEWANLAAWYSELDELVRLRTVWYWTPTCRMSMSPRFLRT